jgi:hypothetical protein
MPGTYLEGLKLFLHQLKGNSTNNRSKRETIYFPIFRYSYNKRYFMLQGSETKIKIELLKYIEFVKPKLNLLRPFVYMIP